MGNRLEWDPRLGYVSTVVCSGNTTCPECGATNVTLHGMMGAGKALVCERCYNADNPHFEPDLTKRLGLLFFDQKPADGRP